MAGSRSGRVYLVTVMGVKLCVLVEHGSLAVGRVLVAGSRSIFMNALQ